MKRLLRLLKPNKTDRGSTLIEMVVSFALLAVFVSTATLIISNVTTLYYRVRGESYARQVGDIVTQKISSQLEGAKYNALNAAMNPCIYSEDKFSFGKKEKISGNSIAFYDRTNTRVRIFADEDEGIVKIYYYPITDENTPSNDREATYWTFDKKMYNGYEITRLDFAMANDAATNSTLSDLYSVEKMNASQYPSNVMAIYMTLKSEKYGTYNICRYVYMYDFPTDGDFINKAAKED